MTFTFRRVARTDFPLLAQWLAEQRVLRWWNHEFSPEAIERDFGPAVDGDEPSEDNLVLVDGAPIGLIQFIRYADYPDYVQELGELIAVPDGAVSIDYLIGSPSHIGRGIGTAMLDAFVDRIWAETDASTIIVPVNSANVASWRALKKVGFRVVAQGPLEPDNPIDDPSHEILQMDRPVWQRS